MKPNRLDLSEPFLTANERDIDGVTLFPLSPEAEERARAYLRPIRHETLMGTLDDISLAPRQRADAFPGDVLAELESRGLIEKDQDLAGFIRATPRGREEVCRWVNAQFEKGARRR